MLTKINANFQANISRVQNLIDIYEKHIQKTGAGRRRTHDTDVLRSSLVFLHASLEDFLRSLLIWKLPSASRDEIDKIPLLGSEHKNASKFYMGELVQFQSKTVGDLIAESVTEYLDRWSSFNNIGEIKKAVEKCGVDTDGFRFEVIGEMVSRRHNIVHKADVNNNQTGQGHHKIKSISLVTMKRYLSAVKNLNSYVSNALT